MDTYGWLLDPKRCIECRACEAACKQWNGVETGIGVRYRQVHVRESGSFPQVNAQALSLACNHCENPYCLKVCPTHSIWRRDDGVILINQDTCIGCRLCEEFCPYGVPQYNAARKKMEKCTMCADRIDQNLQPACATICPTGALQWGKWADLKSKGADRVDGFANPNQTRPAIRFVTTGWSAS